MSLTNSNTRYYRTNYLLSNNNADQSIDLPTMPSDYMERNASASWRFPIKKVAEIQITTVVIYKNPHSIRIN